MNARVDNRGAGYLLHACGAILACFLLLSACATGPVGSSPERAARERPGQSEQAESARAERPAAESPDAESSETESPAEDPGAEMPSSPLDEVLAERRRSDYPEITANETGFTITEQVRIDGDARANYERALTLLRQDRYAEGIPLLVRVTEQAPDVTAPYVDLGIAYGEMGDLENAEKALDAARLLSPEHPIVHNELGILYRKAGRFAEARASYEQALAVYSAFHFARRNLGVLCDLYLVDLECALESYTSYLESVDTDPEVEIWIADVRNRLGL